jgi:hypothetical protein
MSSEPADLKSKDISVGHIKFFLRLLFEWSSQESSGKNAGNFS